MGLLNLSDADTSGFEPLDPGRYAATVFEITMDAVKNEGKTPIGTPIIKVQFKLDDFEDAKGVTQSNRRVWTQYVIPPKDYDKGKAQKMKGMIANFFMALGDSEDTVRSAKFDPDFEDYIGKECVVVLGKENKRTRGGEVIQDEYNNPVKGVKPAGSLAGAGSSGGLL